MSKEGERSFYQQTAEEAVIQGGFFGAGGVFRVPVRLSREEINMGFRNIESGQSTQNEVSVRDLQRILHEHGVHYLFPGMPDGRSEVQKRVDVNNVVDMLRGKKGEEAAVNDVEVDRFRKQYSIVEEGLVEYKKTGTGGNVQTSRPNRQDVLIQMRDINPIAKALAGYLDLNISAGQLGGGSVTLGRGMDIVKDANVAVPTREPQKPSWLQKNVAKIALTLGLASAGAYGASQVIQGQNRGNEGGENPSAGGIGANPPIETATPVPLASPTVSPEGPLVITPEVTVAPNAAEPLKVPEGIISAAGVELTRHDLSNGSGTIIVDDNSHLNVDYVNPKWVRDLMETSIAPIAGYGNLIEFTQAANSDSIEPKHFDVFWGQSNVTTDFSKFLVIYEDKKPTYGFRGYNQDGNDDIKETDGYFPMVATDPDAGWWMKVQFGKDGLVIVRIADNMDDYKHVNPVSPVKYQSGAVADMVKRALAAIDVVKENGGSLPPRLDEKANEKYFATSLNVNPDDALRVVLP